MKLPISMLKRFVTTSLSPEELGDLLTMSGFEIEGIEPAGSDQVLEVKVVANRGDGLSALGLAREVLAKDKTASATDLYKQAQNRFERTESKLDFKIAVETDDCTRFAAKQFDGVQNGPSPTWLVDAVTAAGMRSISLLVDLTNFVMIEFGQPLHAYDLDKLKGPEIVVRSANTGEKLKTLNGDEHELQPGQMMICDASGPIGAAGIMGGEATEISASTTRMLLEAAHFKNSSVRRTRKQLGLNTDASYRFERSVDPDGVVSALRRFEDLYSECTGKGAESNLVDVYTQQPILKPVRLRAERASRLLGMEVTADQCAQYLTDLGCQVSKAGSDMQVTPPSWRPDVVLEEDLIEEVGRIHGYDLIPETPIEGTTMRGGTFGLYALLDTSKKTMLRCGLDQMWSHSLRGEHPLDFNPTRRVRVRNPHSPEMACLRSSLLPGLAEAAQRNGGRNFRIFEIGKVFVQGDYQIDESPELGILMQGDTRDPHFNLKSTPQADFWTVKGMVVELSRLMKDEVTFDLPRLPDHRFHPTRQAGVLVDQGRLWVGTIGQLHPDVCEELGLPEDTYAAELDLLVFFQNPDAEIQMRPFSRNPAVRRDIAFAISKEVPFAEIEAKITDTCGEVLEKMWLFDVYEGKGIEPGQHSLAIAMQLRKMGENFTDEEANSVRDSAVKAVQSLGAVPR